MEKANVKLVNEFCAAWASHDAEKLATFMSDDCAVRLSETQPPSKGRQAFVEAVKALFQRVDRVDIEVRETFAVGPLVTNDRIDYITRQGTRNPVGVAGVFFVKGGKIAEWTDYVIRT
jgi:uncharacterized protein (TIGR02246 family)